MSITPNKVGQNTWLQIVIVVNVRGMLCSDYLHDEEEGAITTDPPMMMMMMTMCQQIDYCRVVVLSLPSKCASIIHLYPLGVSSHSCNGATLQIIIWRLDYRIRRLSQQSL